MKVKKLKFKYSGDESNEFWDKVNSLKGADRQEMYSLGVVLQNLEDHVLTQLEFKKEGSVEQEKP